MIDHLIALIANGAPGDRSDGASDQSACGFVVTFVADCSTNGGTCQASKEYSAPPVAVVLSAYL
jgi:hypothetical protein